MHSNIRPAISGVSCVGTEEEFSSSEPDWECSYSREINEVNILSKYGTKSSSKSLISNKFIRDKCIL